MGGQNPLCEREFLTNRPQRLQLRKLKASTDKVMKDLRTTATLYVGDSDRTLSPRDFFKAGILSILMG